MYYYTKFQKIDQMQSFALDCAPELKIHLTRQGSPLYNGRTRTNGKNPQGFALARDISCAQQ
jgi:hypothetical protein